MMSNLSDVIKGVTQTSLGSIWDHSEPLEVPQSLNKKQVEHFFRHGKAALAPNLVNLNKIFPYQIQVSAFYTNKVKGLLQILCSLVSTYAIFYLVQKKMQNRKKLFLLPIDKFSRLKWIKQLLKLELTYPSAVGNH